MLDLAKVTPQDFVMDLGSGDGRNVIAAAKRGARAMGVEYNPDLVELSRQKASDAGVATRRRSSRATCTKPTSRRRRVMALFLLPSNLDKLKDKFLALKPGTRIVMNTFTVEGWEADVTERLENNCDSWCTALLHIVPAKVAGTWQFEGGELALTQEFQKLQGTLTAGGTGAPISEGKMKGEEITFSLGGNVYSGKVDGDRITGTYAAGGAKQTWTATRRR